MKNLLKNHFLKLLIMFIFIKKNFIFFIIIIIS